MTTPKEQRNDAVREAGKPAPSEPVAKAVCNIPNCGKSAAADQPFCTTHRHDKRPYAYCCNGDPKHCDCAKPDHGTALYAAPVEPAPSEERLREALEVIAKCEPTNNKISGNPGSLYGTIFRMKDIARAALSGSAVEDKGGENA